MLEIQEFHKMGRVETHNFQKYVDIQKYFLMVQNNLCIRTYKMKTEEQDAGILIIL